MFNKSPTLYWVIVALWLLLIGAAITSVDGTIVDGMVKSPLVGALYIINILFIAYFWLNGVKDVLYTFWYYRVMKRQAIVPPHTRQSRRPHVVLVYCTRNDFNGSALKRSMHQQYPNYRTVILDDSDQESALREIDEFAAREGIQVVRREDRTGFKAGNLNNFLRHGEYDYFVILDSDEIIPEDFISRALDYFVADSSVGIVQANHVATRNHTLFQRKFARGVDSHWPVYQSVKSRFGFMSLLGHGALISRQCYEASGGFPHVVAEDICFSIEARNVGFRTVFAADITCEEEYPIDYFAFRKRHGKWTEGNMEFIRTNTRGILGSRQLTWFEKLDIVLFTYSLPLTAVFSLFVAINVIVLPLMGETFQYPLWMLVPTGLFLVAPAINDVVYHWQTTGKRVLVSYSFASMLLYGSMYFISLKASLKTMFGASVFHVTPKTSESWSLWGAVRATSGELWFAFAMAVIATACTGSALSVILIIVPAISALVLMVHHQPKVMH